MKISFSARLFLAVVAIAAFAVAAMGIAASWSYSRGFVGYLNEQAVTRMEGSPERLARAYARHGSWDFMRDNRPLYFYLLRGGEEADLAPGTGASWPASGRRPAERPVSDLTGALLRVTLVDAQQRVVIGYGQITPEAMRWPIQVAGETVGTLLLAPFQTVSGTGELRFQHKQARASWVIGAVCVLLAAALALWVARRLLRPVLQVTAATHRLAAGDLSVRVPAASDDETGALARDFNSLADTLESNERMRRAFLADVSHELRTPLGVLHGELEALEDGVHALSPASVKSLQAEVATMNKLVNDLYDLSLADVGELAYHRRDVDVGELLRTTLDAFETRLADAKLTLLADDLPDEPLIAHVDSRRIQQLLNNLLENSVRYTDAGGVVEVRARHDAIATPPVVELSVADSAPGVPADAMPRLFDRFYRVERSRNRASGGAGLGLSISASIVAAHGGTLAATPSPLGGVTMTVRLPCTAAKAPAS